MIMLHDLTWQSQKGTSKRKKNTPQKRNGQVIELLHIQTHLLVMITVIDQNALRTLKPIIFVVFYMRISCVRLRSYTHQYVSLG